MGIDTDIKKKIGNIILIARRDKKLSQEELAKISGLGVNTIKNIERASYDAKITTFYAVCKALDITSIEM